MRALSILIPGITFLSFTLSDVNNYGNHIPETYTSYWSNGKKKAEGKMYMNLRQGEWSLWDSTGTLLMTRFYADGFSWKQTFPRSKYPVASYDWIDTVKGKYFSYRKIVPDSVIHSRRVWRYAPFDKWNPLFINNTVLDTLIEMRLRGEIVVGEDDQMINLLSPGEFSRRLKASDQKIILGYRIKEDWYYDYYKQSGIFAVVNICPVLKSGSDSLNLGWIVFDDVVQAKLASMSFVPSYQSDYPETYHEMLFQRCYKSIVYQYTNIGNKTLEEMFPDPAMRAIEQENVEWEYFDWEHAYWVDHYRKLNVKKDGK